MDDRLVRVVERITKVGHQVVDALERELVHVSLFSLNHVSQGNAVYVLPCDVGAGTHPATGDKLYDVVVVKSAGPG